MKDSHKNWLIVLGAGAVAAGGVVVAVPVLTAKAIAVAALSFIGSAGGAAKMLHTEKPSSGKAKKDKRGQVADDEDPR